MRPLPCLGLLVLPAFVAQTASIRPLDYDRQSFKLGFAWGMSDDGTVVGNITVGNIARPVKWSPSGEFTDLGQMGGTANQGIAWAISADGAHIAGYSSSPLGREAFIWSEATGLVGLGSLLAHPFQSEGLAISADGKVVVGTSFTQGFEAFRWTAGTGMQGLGDLAGGQFWSEAYAVNADGSVVVGRGYSANGQEAFRWTQAGSMQPLGDLPGGGFQSVANAVSADGTVVVGTGASTLVFEAFRWTAATGMVGLGALPPTGPGATRSEALGVSADGRVIVGKSAYGGACLWRNGGKPEALRPLLTEQGVDLTALGWFELVELRAVQVKGEQIIVAGTGYHGASFLDNGPLVPFVAEISAAAPPPVLVFHRDAPDGSLVFEVPPGFALQRSPTLAGNGFVSTAATGSVSVKPLESREFFRLVKLP